MQECPNWHLGGTGEKGMLNYNQDSQGGGRSWILLWKIIGIICLVTVLVFAFSHGSFVDRLQHEHPTAAILVGW